MAVVWQLFGSIVRLKLGIVNSIVKIFAVSMMDFVCTFTVNVQRSHDQSIFTISNGKYIWFCKVLIMSFIEEKS